MKINLKAIIMCSLTGLTFITVSCSKANDYQPKEMERRTKTFSSGSFESVAPEPVYKQSQDGIADDTIRKFILPEGVTLSSDSRLKLEAHNTGPVKSKKILAD